MKISTKIIIVLCIICVALGSLLYINRPKQKTKANTPVVITQPTKQEVKKADAVIKVKNKVTIPNKPQPGDNGKEIITGTTTITDQEGKTIGTVETPTTITRNPDDTTTVETNSGDIVINLPKDKPIPLKSIALMTDQFSLGAAYSIKQYDIKLTELDLDVLGTTQNIGVGASLSIKYVYVGVAGTYDFVNCKWEPGYYIGLKFYLK